eukprot:5518661-Prymnesium_polylepis.2
MVVLDLCVGPRARRSRVPHACHVRVPRLRSPLTHTAGRALCTCAPAGVANSSRDQTVMSSD